MLSETDAALYQAFFMMYYEGMRQEIPEQDMWKLVEIAQSEPDFWEKGAPFDEFAAFFRDSHQMDYTTDTAASYGETLGAYFPEIPEKADRDS